MLRSLLVFKGGNALDFIWQPNRSTHDLDFSVDPGVAQPGLEQLRTLVRAALQGVPARMGVTLGLNGLRQNPPGAKTFITYEAQVGYALASDRRNQERLRQGLPSRAVIPVDISINEVICASTTVDVGAPHPLRVCTIEDIVAEKLRSLLQQTIRNRHCEQDLLDIAVILKSGTPLDRERIAVYLSEKCKARGVNPTHAAFRDPEIAAHARQGYADLRRTTRTTFIAFEDALALLLAFTDSLPLPP